MKAEFDGYAPNYDALLKDPIRDRFAASGAFFHYRKWVLLRRLLCHASGSANALSWLDVGCGRGELLRLGGGAFRLAVGCDPSLEMLRECHDLSVEHQPDSSRLPFPETSFDVITAACVYHHLSAAEQSVLTSEVRRVLRPGGLFVIFEHNPLNPATRLIVSRTPVDANAVLLTAGKCGRLMRAAGLEIRKTAYYLFFPEAVFKSLGRLENSFAMVPLGGQYAVCAVRRAS